MTKLKRSSASDRWGMKKVFSQLVESKKADIIKKVMTSFKPSFLLKVKE
jgi:hypothetical protein